MLFKKWSLFSGGRASMAQLALENPLSDIFLEHFVEAHNAQASGALDELTSGQKQTHWMWFIFPVIRGLGKSDTAQYYAIESIEEANAFINDPYLGNNYKNCLEAVLGHQDKTARAIFNSKIDDWKFKSSLTLFRNLPSDNSANENIQRCLKHFYNNEPCSKTLDIIRNL